MYNYKNQERGGGINQGPSRILYRPLSSMNCNVFYLFSMSRAQSAPAAVISNVELPLQVCDYISQIVAEEVARKRSKILLYALQQVAEKALVDIFFIRFNKAEKELKTVSYSFIK